MHYSHGLLIVIDSTRYSEIKGISAALFAKELILTLNGRMSYVKDVAKNVVMQITL